MENNQDFEDFKNKFYGYANVISAESKNGEFFLNRIYQKKDYFNSLSENERIEFMQSDPDFVGLQKNKDKISTLIAVYYNFIAQNMTEQIEQPKRFDQSVKQQTSK